jgi:hypothetical protein
MAREVWVHAVDLAGAVTLADVPRPVAEELLDEAAAGFAGRRCRRCPRGSDRERRMTPAAGQCASSDRAGRTPGAAARDLDHGKLAHRGR